VPIVIRPAAERSLGGPLSNDAGRFDCNFFRRCQLQLKVLAETILDAPHKWVGLGQSLHKGMPRVGELSQEDFHPLLAVHLDHGPRDHFV